MSGHAPLPISACLLTRNEADRLPRTLAGLVGEVAEIVVHDAESADDTVALARAAGARVSVAPWRGYVAARRALLADARQPWVLMIDADEVLDAGFWAELRQRGFPGEAAAGYAVRRRMHYLGRTLRFAWQPDWKLALARADRASIVGGAVHEALRSEGRIVRLRATMIHYSYRSLADHWERTRQYAALAAADLHARGVRTRWWDLTLRPLWHGLRQALLRGAILDGTRGLLAAAGSAWSAYLRYALLYEQTLAARQPLPAPEPTPGTRP